ncbi:MAG: fasciclin domain-containing protein [Bacteroidota bacterium]
MKKLLFLFLLATASLTLTIQAGFAQSKALSGISDESDYYKFASLVRGAKMDATLAALGTYTVFAPDNLIFRDMPSGKLDSLINDPAKLTTLIKAHIVKGKLTTNDIIKKLTLGKGKTTVINLLGQPIILSRTADNKLLLTDVKGNQAHFLAFDMADPKSVVQGIDIILATGK